MRDSRGEDVERRRIRQKAYRLANWDRVSSQTQAWRKANPDKAREIARNWARAKRPRKYRVGDAVETEFIAGVWIKGVIVSIQSSGATVRFATFEKQVCWRLLRHASSPISFRALPLQEGVSATRTGPREAADPKPNH